jgi:hypothetical protein
MVRASAHLYQNGEIHCGDQVFLVDQLFQKIERETGLNANRPVKILQMLWDHYKATK